MRGAAIMTEGVCRLVLPGLLRRESSTCEWGGRGLPIHWVGGEGSRFKKKKNCERWGAHTANPNHRDIILAKLEWDSCPSAHKSCVCPGGHSTAEASMLHTKSFPRQ